MAGLITQRQESAAAPQAGRGFAAELDRIVRAAGSPRAVDMPQGMAGNAAWAVTVTLAQADYLASLAGKDKPSEMLAQRPADAPKVKSIEIIYSNDGKGPFPNLGGGADQELTASVSVRAHYDNEGKGLTSAGYNFEIWTPTKGGAPVGVPGYEFGMYPSPSGPASGGYKGLVYADFEYRLLGNGQKELSLLTHVGANSTAIGDFMQTDVVHHSLEIAKFNWEHEPTEFYGALGVKGRQVTDLIDSDGLMEGSMRLRLTVEGSAMTGTHQSTAGAGASLALQSAWFRMGGAGVRAQVKVGADGKGIMRYNDSGGLRAGAEVGVSNEIRVDFDKVRLPLLGPTDFSVFAGGRSQQSTLGEGRAPAGEDGPGLTGAWLGPGSKTQGYIGIEIPIN